MLLLPETQNGIRSSSSASPNQGNSSRNATDSGNNRKYPDPTVFRGNQVINVSRLAVCGLTAADILCPTRAAEDVRNSPVRRAGVRASLAELRASRAEERSGEANSIVSSQQAKISL